MTGTWVESYEPERRWWCAHERGKQCSYGVRTYVRAGSPGMNVYDDSSNLASPISYRQNTLKIPQPSQAVIIEEPSVAGSAEDASEIERGKWRTGLELGARVILVAHTARRDRGSLNCCLLEAPGGYSPRVKNLFAINNRWQLYGGIII